MTAEPRLLILETSSRAGLAAVSQGASVRAVRRLDEARHHARDLVPAVAELLAEQSWRPSDLHGVVISRGPGSYTGLRVGMISARTLAYATGCALLAVDTFAAVARQAPEGVARLDVLADAQQERVYVQEFSRAPEGTGWLATGSLAIRPLTEWLALRTPGAWVSGPGLHAHRRRLPDDVPMVEESAWHPLPESLLHLALPRYLAGERDDIWALEPHYLRPSAAEEQWQKP